MSVSRADRRFWVVTLAAVLACALTASLGFWQLRRADLKNSLQAAIAERATLPELTNRDLQGVADSRPVLHRKARLLGHWLSGGTVYLDNRQMGQRQGFYVVTPLRLSGDNRVLYVQRGFVPRDFQDRTRVPAVPTDTSEVVVLGRMAAPPALVYELGEPGNGLIRQNLHVASAALALGVEAIDASLVQLEPSPGSAPDGLQRDWPQVANGVHKHHGYAFQWFGLCALLIVLYVWFQLISPQRRKHHPPPGLG